jgi:uncharacterized YigZ family protein
MEHGAVTKRYPIPAESHRVEETIRRSRFITTVGHSPTVEDARAFVARIREEFSDATHNCWAFVVGPPGDSSTVGCSDAGEPHGTAGRPMLAVLLGSGIGDVVAVTTRYYGGTKLGRGGLARAYSGGVRAALEGCPLAESVATETLTVIADYPGLTALKRLFPRFEAEVLEETFGARVTLEIRLPEEHVDSFRVALADLSRGQASVSEG